MTIALIVDNIFRDLPGLVLLATYLSKQGATCFLVPVNRQREEISALAPDFVLLNYLRVVNQDFADQLMRCGIQVGVLDTEGGALVSFDTYQKTMAKNAQIRSRIAGYFCWGKKTADYLLQRNYYRKNQLLVTGAPKFDFYAVPLRQSNSTRSSYIDRFPQPLVLVNSNFPLANPRYPITPEEEVEMLVKEFHYERSYILRWQRVQQKTLNIMVKLTKRLATDFPNVTFIYRPHPFENPRRYEQVFREQENTHLEKLGTVEGWIFRSIAVIQRSCSTAIEAGMAGVPAFSPRWIPTPFSLPVAESVSIPCSSYEQLHLHLSACSKGEFPLPQRVKKELKNVVTDWFFAIDGKAHQRIAMHILQLLKKKTTIVQKRTCRYMHYMPVRQVSWQDRILRIIRMKINLPVHWSFLRMKNISDHFIKTDQPEKIFTAGDVQRIVQSFDTANILVMAASEKGVYDFHYQGKSIVITAT